MDRCILPRALGPDGVLQKNYAVGWVAVLAFIHLWNTLGVVFYRTWTVYFEENGLLVR